MPTESIIALTGITIAFAVFAFALAWCDIYTGKARRPGPAE